MKNIFLKETDQKSKLYRNLLTGKLFILEGKVTDVSECNREYHFIYVTNDETIKEGDWCMSLCDDESYEEIYQCKDVELVDEEDKKIILTNDPTLIEDGVQEVPSQFLSFYAENTPDYVEVDDYVEQIGWESDANGRDMILNKRFYSLDFSPKKELKTEENIIDQWLEKYGNPEIMKQVEREAEELELQYYAEKRYPEDGSFTIMDIDIAEYRRFAFIAGAKWQQERSYSEEEVLDLLFDFQIHRNDLENCVEAREWFEQFKKK